MIAGAEAVALAIAGTTPAVVVPALLAARRARRRADVRDALAAALRALHEAGRTGATSPVSVARVELELRRALAAIDGPKTPGVDLHTLLRVQVRTWRPIATAHHVGLVLLPGPTVPLSGADVHRIAQATSPALAAAIERALPGSTIEVRTRTVGERFRIEVHPGGAQRPTAIAEQPGARS